MPNRALQLFDEMQQQGLEPNLITYTALSKMRKVQEAGEGLAAVR